MIVVLTQPALHLGSSAYVLLEPVARVVTRHDLRGGTPAMFVPARCLTEHERNRALEAWQRNEPGSWKAAA